jgi:perosamine synthetase
MNKFIPISEPDLNGNEKKYIDDCIKTGWISSKGDYIVRFERAFAAFNGSHYAISTCNGTTALHVAIAAMDIGYGDEVIIPDFTFIATANAVTYTRAKPIFVDVSKETGNIDVLQLEKKITKRTKAIIAVHLFGYPADMRALVKLAKKYNLYLIEDAAEAHGAEVLLKGKKWKKVGSIGDVGCFSFYGNKIMTTGEGGMVVTDNADIAQKIRMLRDHGQDPQKKYYYPIIGFNYRMTNLQAAIGLAQLERIDTFIQKKKNIAFTYNQYLNNNVNGISQFKEYAWQKSVYWMYSILVDVPYAITRDKLMDKLKKNNIETRPFFYPLHTLPPYKSKIECPHAVYMGQHGLCLPCGINISQKDIQFISDIIKRNT